MENEKKSYFIFSSSQMKRKIEVESKIGKKYLPGTVLVNGSYKQFTDIVNDVTILKYSDAIIVAEGYLSKMKYVKR